MRSNAIPPVISSKINKAPPPRSTSKVFDELIKLLEDPREEWHEDYCTWKHRSGIQIWTANTWCDRNTYPVEMPLSMLRKWRLCKALAVSRKNQVARKLGL